MYLLVDILELELQLSLFLIPDSHHFLKVQLDLDHLLVKTGQLLIRHFSGLVHF